MIRALVFDFDGIILDTEGPEYQAWQEVFEEYGQSLPVELWAPGIGTLANQFDPVDYLESVIDCSLDRDAVRRRCRSRHVELTNGSDVMVGVREYIADAEALGLRLGIASSATREWVVGHLERLKLLAHWDYICCSSDVGVPKPAPDVYLGVLDALAVKPDESVALEDSRNGMLAARAAGMHCVVVPHALTRALDLTEADITLSALSDMRLATLLEALTERTCITH